MKLSTNLLRDLTKISGVGEKAVERLIGSIRVEAVRPMMGEIESTTKSLDIGLRLEALGNRLLGRGDPALKQLVSDSLRSYQQTCPVVAAWVGRGDFNPEKLPAEITFARILHANRTAGRLRAAIMRKYGS